jgi:hypothetical protein
VSASRSNFPHSVLSVCSRRRCSVVLDHLTLVSITVRRTMMRALDQGTTCRATVDGYLRAKAAIESCLTALQS